MCVGKAYEKALNDIGLRMLSTRFSSRPPSEDREEAFKSDWMAWMKEYSVTNLRTTKLAGDILNPYKLFKEVITREGIESVSYRREARPLLWTIRHGSNAKSNRMRKYYMDYLYGYERHVVHGIIIAVKRRDRNCTVKNRRRAKRKNKAVGGTEDGGDQCHKKCKFGPIISEMNEIEQEPEAAAGWY